MSKKRRGFVFALAAVLLVYAGWIGWQTFRFKTYPSPTVPAGSSAEPGPPVHEVMGVYHIHSRYSDGWKSVEQIASIAARAGLDFIILTDHGKPNLLCLSSQGWKDGLLVLAGSELSVNRGHLVGLEFRSPSLSFSQTTEIAAEEIASLGGFSIIAHPYSKVRWSWGTTIPYSGIEIIDEDTMFRKNIPKSLLYLPALLVNPRLALLRIIAPPRQAIRKWDELNGRRQNRIYGYFSADAHYLYRAVFPIFHLHVLLENPLAPEFEAARRQVFDSLKNGHFYSAVDGAAGARGFNVWAEYDSKKFSMGSELDTMSEPAGPAAPLKLRVTAPFSVPFEIRLLCNGQVILRSEKRDVTFEAGAPGVYRVEVYLKAKSPLDSDVPWILSNPIFFNTPLRKERR